MLFNNIKLYQENLRIEVKVPSLCQNRVIEAHIDGQDRLMNVNRNNARLNLINVGKPTQSLCNVVGTNLNLNAAPNNSFEKR